MRWSSCVSWRRTGNTELRRPSSTSSSSDTPRDEPKSSQSQDPSLARLFSDAALFGKILTSRPDLPDGSLPADGQSTHDSLNGFSRLVAPDLDDNERAVSEKFAQISVSNWSAAGAHTLPPGVDPGESDESASDDAHDRVSPGGAVKEAGEPDFEAKLDPIEIVDLLEQEFGALAPDGEERLLLESDATLLRDVVILGVVHLTTHRLTFHASLLSSQPNYQQGVIKSGPLSPDMISTYNSSRDEDKIKPIRSILLSSVKDVSQVESKPRHITTLYESAQGIVDSTVEFDTDESACDWKRELLGALFLYRRNRRSVLTPDDADDLNAVRINVPLSRLESVERTQLPAFAGLFSFTFDPTSSNGAPDGVPTEKSASASEEISILDTPSVKQVLQLGILREDPLWKDIMAYADKEKLAASKSNVDWPGYRVFIDLDPRTSNAPETSDSNLSDLVKSVSFTLGLDTTKEMWIKKAHVHRFFGSYYGQFAVTTECVGFWSKSVTGGDIRYRVPLSHVKAVKPHDRGRARDHTLVLEIQGQRSLHLTYLGNFTPTVSSPRHTQTLDRISESTPLSSDDSTILSIRNPTSILAPLSRVPSTVQRQHLPHALKSVFPKAINLPEEVLLSMPSKHFACLTIGSRGDVQPYIALGRGLQKEGHRVTIVTHEEYKEWVTGFGLEHRTAGGDPGALMKLSVENKMFSPQFFKESLSNFRTWLDDLLVDSWEQCKDVDVILESPSAMAGVHIAEALHIPYFRTFTMPWTKTKEFPHAFLGPPVESPTFNAASYVLFDNVLWTATSSQINRWRKNTLGIGHTDMGHLAQSKIPFIYNFSQAVVPKPLDWGDATVVSGYWFLDNPELGWSPPQSLVDWMAKARSDGKPIVYIGFGSITVPNPKLVTERIIRGVLKSGVRAIISKGWSARMSKGGDEDVVFPEECYSLDKVPHDWLFPQIDAALHHGGAGTTGASLRGETSLSVPPPACLRVGVGAAGIPTLIRPWFGDQFFWASRVQKLGAGIKLNSLHSKEVSQALKKATSDRVMKEKATSVGERIRQEDGVRTAISTIYTYLPRAGRDRKTIEH
ncbi:UDP-Glycosyltransferase/glycogen phosphorylase [Lactarius pseudohatsudake]|nr:UDP-Glycosyltransferase/glycogen phosphorylase [Lactarius pseudohatsudake]